MTLSILIKLIYILNYLVFVKTLYNVKKISIRRKSQSLYATTKQHLILFNPYNLRYHDNPCLNYAEQNRNDGDQYNLLFVNDPQLNIKASYMNALESKINNIGGKLHIKHDSLINAFDVFYKELISVQQDKQTITDVVTTEVIIEPYKSLYQEFHEYLRSKHNIKLTILSDNMLTGVITDNYLDHAKMYQVKNIPLPNMNKYKINFNQNILNITRSEDVLAVEATSADVSIQPSSNKESSNEDDDEMDGEELALSIVNDYLTLGDDLFTKKYQDQYIQTIAKSVEHQKSFERLRISSSTISSSSRSTTSVLPITSSSYGHFFQGEVLSGLLAPLISQGLVSPRLLIHCRKVLYPGWKGSILSAMERPLICRIRNEIIRKDWQTQIAISKSNNMNIPQSSTSSSSSKADLPSWNISFRHWRGYIQREATMLSPLPQPTSTVVDVSSHNARLTEVSSKPMLVLIHGFGGSLEQYTGLAKILSEHFDIYAIDSLGFGQSEKPPVSYNQLEYIYIYIYYSVSLVY